MKGQARDDCNKLAEARDTNRDLTNKLEDIRAEHTVAQSKVNEELCHLIKVHNVGEQIEDSFPCPHFRTFLQFPNKNVS
jgi:hypothetical protein